MKLLFLIDPLAKLKAYKDTSVSMMRAAAARERARGVAEELEVRDRCSVQTAAGVGGVVDLDERPPETLLGRVRGDRAALAVQLRSD